VGCEAVFLNLCFVLEINKPLGVLFQGSVWMKKYWSLRALAVACGCHLVGGVCLGQEVVETQTQTQVQVQVVGEGEGPGSKKSEVRVVQVQSTKPEEMVARIEKTLKESGLDEEARKKVVEQVKELAAKVPGGKPMVMAIQSRKGDTDAKAEGGPQIQVQVQAVPEGQQQNEEVESQQMIFVDGDGKQHKVQVIRKGVPQIQGGRVQVQMIPQAAGGNGPQAVPQAIPPLPPNGKLAPGNVQPFPLAVPMNAQPFPVDIPMMVQGFPLQAQVQLGQAIQGGNRYALGVSLEPPAGDESAPGLVIKEVMDNSAASEAGLEPGDRIVVIDGEDVESVEQVVELVQKAGADDKTMDLVVQRGGGDEEKQIEVKPRASALPQGIEQLENMLQQIPGGIGAGGGFFVPQGVPGAGWNVGGEALEEVKAELKSIREDLQEIKEMLAEIKAMEEEDEEDDDD
jgi:membrane-associated protease RseP (regulator of RpoE activity)